MASWGHVKSRCSPVSSIATSSEKGENVIALVRCVGKMREDFKKEHDFVSRSNQVDFKGVLSELRLHMVRDGEVEL